jgi:hypothetical protein
MINNDAMKTVYLERFVDDIMKWYKKQTNPKKLICDITKPRIGPNYVNASAQLKREYKKFSSFDKKTQEAVQMMLDFIKTIWASNNNHSYEYLLKWFANMVRGNKNLRGFKKREI